MTKPRVPSGGYERRCTECSRLFRSRRADAERCGDVCRKEAKRRRDGVPARDGSVPALAPEFDPSFVTPHRAPTRDGEGWRDPGGALWRWAGDVLRSDDGRERRLWRAVGEHERDRVARFLLLRRA